MKLKKLFYLVFIMVLIYTLFFVPKAYGATKITYDGTNLDETKYPGYKALLDNLKNTYGYNIELYYTGIDWGEALTLQYQGHGTNSSFNLFYPDNTKKGRWYCPICGEQNYDTGIPCASIEAIAYMLDPRNSLADESVYQFMNFEGNNLDKVQIGNIVEGTYLNNQEVIDALFDAASGSNPDECSNLNAAFLVAKIIIEQGSNGSILSKGEGYQGDYVGVYNFFNYGATVTSECSDVIKYGLNYARAAGWTSKRAAIIGGAKLIKESFVDLRGQNTFYFLKYNYAGKSSWAAMQYEQNIMGAESKGSLLRKYYKKQPNAASPTMVIPLYENMPVEKAARPTTNSRSSLTYEEGVIEYAPSGLKVRAGQGIKTVHINTISNGSKVKIIKRADYASSDGYYWDLICASDGTYGYAPRIVAGDVCIKGTGVYKTIYGRDDTSGDGKQVIATPDGYIHMTPTVMIEDIKKVYPTAIVKAVDGNEMYSGDVGTYSKVEIDGKTYTVVKRGDLDGDGHATILDVIRIFNHAKEVKLITDPIEYQTARIVNGDKVTILDVTKLLNYIKGLDSISL